MKKVLTILIGFYTITYIGGTIWAIAKPESYGRWFGKMWGSTVNALCKTEEEI